MKQFILGLVVSGLLFGGVAYYFYSDGNQKLDAAKAQAANTGRGTNPQMNTVNSLDSNTLAAKLLTKQLEELDALKGEKFDGHYIMLLDTALNNISTVANEARKGATDKSVKEMAEKTYDEADTRITELIPLRNKFGLIHDD